MARLAVDQHLIVIIGNVLLDGPIFIKLITELIKIGDLQVGAMAQTAGCRF